MALTERQKQVLDLVREAGILRPRDLDPHGIPRVYLSRLARKGLVQRLARGLYALPDVDLGEKHTLAEVCKRVPHGVICLLSALSHHEIGTQSPHRVWLAIDYKARLPKANGLPLKIVRFSGKALTEGVEEHDVEGVTVRVYCPAKTVADCFKYRGKIGLGVALEALQDSWRKDLVTMDDLWTYAKICRMTTVMRPYLETLT
ncbi:MAG: type IV toxin-antitoxin system AbiEi family antitoxin domain-containing protein [Planctomycetota bacterium]